MRILMPSIVDPRQVRGGSWTATRGLVRIIELAWPGASVDCIALPSLTRPAHRLRQLRCLLQSSVGARVPAKILFATSETMRQRVLESIGANTPDVVVLNGGDLLWLLPSLPVGVPVVAVAHNIEHELYAAQVDAITRTWPSLVSLLQSDLSRLREYEWVGLGRVRGTVFFSEDDRRTAIDACPGLKSIVVPLTFDYEPTVRVPGNHVLRLGMFADFTWWPNRASLRWFLDEIWPSVTPPVELHLFGYGSEAAARGASRLHVHGSVADPRDPFAQCDIMIAPIVTGAGVKVKVAEALYNRVPVVATPLAVRGLPRDAAASVRTCGTASEWITFLGSDAARAFSRRPIPAAVASSFHIDASVYTLRHFFESLVAGTGDGRQRHTFVSGFTNQQSATGL